MSVSKKRHKAARVIAIGVLIFLVAIPVGAMAVIAKSHGQSDSKLTPNCLSLQTSQTAVTTGSSGVILFSCGSGAALIVGKSDQFRPIFTLPAGYTALKIVNHNLGGSDCNLGSTLVSGKPIHLNGPGNFDYCAGYTNAPNTGLGSFKVAWSK